MRSNISADACGFQEVISVRKHYKAATVCSVLLCVLLLTAVIALCVHINTKSTNHTQELHQLLTKITNLTEEKNQLLTNITNLTEGTHQLLTEKTNLIRERDGLLSKNKELFEERDTLRQMHGLTASPGADLTTINNREAQHFVQKNILSGTCIWFGLTDSDEENKWKWVDGSTPTFWYWSCKEPNGRQRENCALIHSAKWADYPCGDTFPWICEKKILRGDNR
ncbi:Collectin-12 [Labeo rohita]|uniref:Collectin-12 n=1 Tax=Labeo rohita TaxID=84645 RepID=A0ABQ8L5C0_LABRO|nr:Collectin-12 [Labeo rohita]